MGKLPPILAAGKKRHNLRRLLVLGLCLVVIGGMIATLLITAHNSNLKGDSNESVASVLQVPSKSETASTAIARKTLAGGKDKLVALTFDDGPGSYTLKIAQVLIAKNVPATFFLIGRQISKRENVVSELRADGFELEDHTWDHTNLSTLDLTKLRFEMQSTAVAIGGVKYVRPPSGAFDPLVIATAHALGLKIALWNVDTIDWKDRNAAHILARVEAAVRPGAIVLMHDAGGDRSQTAAVLPQVIDWLRAHGYTLVTVDELGGAAIPGTIK